VSWLLIGDAEAALANAASQSPCPSTPLVKERTITVITATKTMQLSPMMVHAIVPITVASFQWHGPNALGIRYGGVQTTVSAKARSASV